MYPCPCGYYNDPVKECTCSMSMVKSYQKKNSGPLMDRIDIHVEVPRVPFEKLSDKRSGEPSAVVRERVGQGSLSFRGKVEVEDFERYRLIFGQVGGGMNVARYFESEPSYVASIS